MRRALVLSGDARKAAYEEPDQLFGYAGTATAIEYDPEKKTPAVFSEVGTDGTGYDAIIRPQGGTRNPIDEHTFDLVECEDGRRRHGMQTRMKGMDVFAFGITTAPKSIRKLAKTAGFDTSDTCDTASRETYRHACPSDRMWIRSRTFVGYNSLRCRPYRDSRSYRALSGLFLNYKSLRFGHTVFIIRQNSTGHRRLFRHRSCYRHRVLPHGC